MSKPIQALPRLIGRDTAGLLGLYVLTLLVFGLSAPKFLSAANFESIAFQLPDLGLLTLAMLAPIMANGINLAIIAIANLSGLTLAWILNINGGADAGVLAFAIGVIAALAVGGAFGAVMGAVIAYFGAHPILASLAMMIFLKGLGEFLTRGGDISGFPDFLREFGHGAILGVPVPMLVFVTAAILWHLLLARTRHGFAVAMIGSNPRASEYSGLHVKRTITLLYALSGVMCALAGIVMLTRFNSVRVGHGDALLLVTVLACFLGGVDPFGGFGRVAPVFIALVILQTLSSGLNLLGANQHLSTAVWGLFLLAVMVLRSGSPMMRLLLGFTRPPQAAPEAREQSPALTPDSPAPGHPRS
ncbi:ABC transporter permease [Bradyrhizobium sp. HKCCYLS3077]|uniref:ABC transporter permease n=1 Tax=Bradyrhizobium sp. HKCCYLS3077 TaxID=3420761 RepID=UPI003EB91849